MSTESGPRDKHPGGVNPSRAADICLASLRVGREDVAEGSRSFSGRGDVRMKPRSLAVGGLLLAFLAAGADPIDARTARVTQKKKVKKPAKPAAKGKVYRTPEQVFDA